jgi:hypothetical protein
VILALDIIKATPRLTEADIFMDCQPAITAIIAISSPKPQPGQYLVATFHTLLRHLLTARRSLRIRLHWVPAHVSIVGNEAVNVRTKEAATGASSALFSCIKLFEKPLPLSKSATIDAGAFRERWLAEWTAYPHFTRISLFDDARPSNAVLRMYEDLSRPQCSVLTQLRTGHIGLNAYLFRFHLAPSPSCTLCNAPESVPHFLLLCPAYRRQRLDLIRRLGTARLSLKLLLSAKNDAKPVLDFVRDTGRLPRYSL